MLGEVYYLRNYLPKLDPTEAVAYTFVAKNLHSAGLTVLCNYPRPTVTTSRGAPTPGLAESVPGSVTDKFDLPVRPLARS